MRGKGKQFVPAGRKVMLGFPGGAGYGDPAKRDPALVKRDLARGYITAQTAADEYGMTAEDIAAVEAAIKAGEDI
jgi:N-methylhydantoinase B